MLAFETNKGKWNIIFYNFMVYIYMPFKCVVMSLSAFEIHRKTTSYNQFKFVPGFSHQGEV